MSTTRPFWLRLVRYISGILGRGYRAGWMKFIHVIGTLTEPGQWPSGALQAWALRRMGVHCPSSRVWVGPRTTLESPHRLRLGTRVMIGPDSRITGHGADVEIGDDFLCAPGLYINSGTHDLITLEPKYAPVKIGVNVWCGTRVTICTGVEIGDGCTIGAGSLVLQNIPANHVAVGSPCRPLRASTRDKVTWTNFRR